MPDLRIIGIVRDPRAVVASALDVPFGPTSHVLIADGWALDQEIMLQAADQLGPARCRIVRYEDLVSRPDRFRASLATFIGQLDPKHLDSGQELSESAATDVASFVLPFEWWKDRVYADITDERVTAWKSRLTARQVSEVEAVCRKAMRTFGYAQASTGRFQNLRTLASLPPATHLRRIRFRRSRRQMQRRISSVRLA